MYTQSMQFIFGYFYIIVLEDKLHKKPIPNNVNLIVVDNTLQ